MRYLDSAKMFFENTFYGKDKLYNMQACLLFFIVLKIIFYLGTSPAHAIKYYFLVFFSVLASFCAELCFRIILSRQKISYISKTELNQYPQITGLAVGCFISFGYKISIVFICMFISIFFVKILFGNFSNNIFNAPAFCMILMYSVDPAMVQTASMSSLLDVVLLDMFKADNVLQVSEFSNLQVSLFSGELPYLSLAMIFFTILVFFYFFIVIYFVGYDISLPLITIISLFVICFSFVGFFNGTSHIGSNILQFNDFFKYIINSSGNLGHLLKTMLFLIYLLKGSTLLGIIFCTITKNMIATSGVSKCIIGFFIAFCIFYTKIFTYNPIGVFYAVIISNALIPALNSTIKSSQAIQTTISLLLIFLGLIIGFLAFLTIMKGV